MKRTVYLFVFLLLLSACVKKGQDITEEETVAPDSVAIVDTIDTLEAEEVLVPKAADLVFNDFIDNFMSSRSFQRNRVKFPLEYDAFGQKAYVQKSQWKFDSLYAGQDVFLMLFANEKALENRNSDATDKVEVQALDFNKDRLKQYNFSKNEGLWTLSSIKEERLEDMPANNFFRFYKQFASDSIYRQGHIHDPFTLIFQDEDTYQQVQGVASPEQWNIYAPELPAGKVTNLNFSQSLSGLSKVVLMIGTQQGAMSSILTFRQQNGEWKLIKLENN